MARLTMRWLRAALLWFQPLRRRVRARYRDNASVVVDDLDGIVLDPHRILAAGFEDDPVCADKLTAVDSDFAAGAGVRHGGAVLVHARDNSMVRRRMGL
mgnify:CR=1 FL=1